MPVTTRAQRHAAQIASISHPDVLAQVFEHLPLGDQCFTVSRLSKQWRQWAAPKHAMAKRPRPARHNMGLYGARTWYQPPLWWVQEAWDDLTRLQRYCAAARAAFNGNLAVLEFALRDADCHVSNVCLAAASGGQLEALKVARKSGCPWNEHVSYWAASDGRLAMLQWARRNGCPWDAWTCACAAAAGHLRLLQWARENGCPWDVATCSSAALHGRRAVLQWAHRHGCPWDKGTCACAAERGHLSVLQWAFCYGCPCDLGRCWELAMHHKHDDVVRWCEQMAAGHD